MVIRGSVNRRGICVISMVRFALKDAKRIFFFFILVQIHWERTEKRAHTQMKATTPVHGG